MLNRSTEVGDWTPKSFTDIQPGMIVHAAQLYFVDLTCESNNFCPLENWFVVSRLGFDELRDHVTDYYCRWLSGVRSEFQKSRFAAYQILTGDGGLRIFYSSDEDLHRLRVICPRHTLS